MKPINFPNTPEAQKFLEYAKNSPYYFQIKQKLEENNYIRLKKIKKLEGKIKRYKLLKIMTFGLFKNMYDKKIDIKVKQIKLIKSYCILEIID